MPRAPGGTYTLPVASFVSGTVIKSADVNSDFNDIASTLTNSVDTRGYSSMSGQFKAWAGAAGTPGLTFATDLTSGFFSNGVGQFTLVTGGATVATFNSDQTVTWAQNQTFSANISVGGTLAVTGATTLAGVSFTGALLFTQSADPSTPAATKVDLYSKVSPFTGFQTFFAKEERGLIYPVVGVYGQCRLTLSGGNLKLSPYFGNLLTINGIPQVVPDAGITLGLGGLSAGVFYYVYAYESAGTMTLEASTSVPLLQTGTGLYYKTGDTSRTLVGAGYTDTGPAWADTNGKLYTLSYFNRKPKQSITRLTADRALTTSTYAEFNTEIRANFISWSDEYISSSLTTDMTVATTSVNISVGIATDSTTVPDVTTTSNVSSAVTAYSFTITNTKNSLTEAAVHYQTLLGKSATGANAITAKGSALASDTPTFLILQVMG